MYNIKNYKFNNIKVEMEVIEKEIAEYEYLVKQIEISEENIDLLQKNMNKFENPHILLKQQYYKLLETEKVLFADIFDVNKRKKALGYLPSKYFKKTGRNIDYFVRFAIENNLDFYISNKYNTETVAVYDRYMLTCILNDNKNILIDAGLSLNVDEFVEFIMDKPSVYYEDNPELFILIALAFNDHRLERIV